MKIKMKTSKILINYNITKKKVISIITFNKPNPKIAPTNSATKYTTAVTGVIFPRIIAATVTTGFR